MDVGFAKPITIRLFEPKNKKKKTIGFLDFR